MTPHPPGCQGVDARTPLLEIGRRRLVGGLEDMITDIALDIAAQGERRTRHRAVVL